MSCKIEIALLCAALIMVLSITNTAKADSRLTCPQGLSATDKPVFTGLKAAKFDTEEDSSTEGGEYQVFSNARGIPVYVVASHYGETGKRVVLYKLLNGSTSSYSARISNYRYVEPIYSGTVKVAHVETSSFIVCDDVVVRGVGSKGISHNLLKSAKEILTAGIELYNLQKTRLSKGQRSGN